MGNTSSNEISRKLRQSATTLDYAKEVPLEEVSNSSRWRSSFLIGQPAYIANPKYGACSIYARRVITTQAFGKEIVYYLVKLVRPSSISPFSSSTIDSGGRGGISADTSVYYEVPSVVFLNGTRYNYVIPLKFIISNFEYNRMDPNASLVTLQTNKTLKTILLSEFMNEVQPPFKKKPNKKYKIALTVFYKTNPLYQQLNLGISRTVSAAAKPYILDQTSTTIGTSLSSSSSFSLKNNDEEDIIGSLISSSSSSSSLSCSVSSFTDNNKSFEEIFHPELLSDKNTIQIQLSKSKFEKEIAKISEKISEGEILFK
jgi:hypothetical protein